MLKEVKEILRERNNTNTSEASCGDHKREDQFEFCHQFFLELVDK